jgi:hypothetical protein
MADFFFCRAALRVMALSGASLVFAARAASCATAEHASRTALGGQADTRPAARPRVEILRPNFIAAEGNRAGFQPKGKKSDPLAVCLRWQQRFSVELAAGMLLNEGVEKVKRHCTACSFAARAARICAFTRAASSATTRRTKSN